jgi:hypothetical protein
MTPLTIAAPTLIAAASATAASGMLAAYVYFARRAEAHTALDEALALAQTRGEVIADLRLRLAALEQQVAQTTADRDALLHELLRAREPL